MYWWKVCSLESLKSKFLLLALPNFCLSVIWRNSSIVSQNFKPPRKFQRLVYSSLSLAKNLQVSWRNWCYNTFLWVFYTFSATKKEIRMFRCVFHQQMLVMNCFFFSTKGYSIRHSQPASNYSIHHWLLSQQGVTQFVIGYSPSKWLLNSSYIAQPARGYWICHWLLNQQGTNQFVIGYSASKELSSQHGATLFVIDCAASTGLLNLSLVLQPARGYWICHGLHSQQGFTQFVIGYSTSKRLLNSS